MRFTLRLKAVDVVLALAIAAAVVWFAWPAPFVEPPADAELQSSEGLLMFQPGRWEPSMWIDGSNYLCSFSRNRGPHSACLLERRDAPPARVVAKWYWHPTSTGGRVRLLVSVASTDGEVLLSPSVQRGRLLEAGRGGGAGTEFVLGAAGAIFIALLAVFSRFNRKGQM